MGTFLQWLLPELSMALTSEALLVSNHDVKASIGAFLYFKPTPDGPAVLSIGREPSGPEHGERVCLFGHQAFDSEHAWALEAFLRYAMAEVLPEKTLIRPRVVITGIDALGSERDPARVQALIDAVIKVGAREVLVPELYERAA